MSDIRVQGFKPVMAVVNGSYLRPLVLEGKHGAFQRHMCTVCSKQRASSWGRPRGVLIRVCVQHGSWAFRDLDSKVPDCIAMSWQHGLASTLVHLGWVIEVDQPCTSVNTKAGGPYSDPQLAGIGVTTSSELQLSVPCGCCPVLAELLELVTCPASATWPSCLTH